MYSPDDILWLFTKPKTRTQMNPIEEQKNMCHMVRVMGKGKPEKASSLSWGYIGVGGGEVRVHREQGAESQGINESHNLIHM